MAVALLASWWHEGPMSLLAVFIGALCAGWFGLVFAAGRMLRSLPAWSALLIVASLFYPLFAAERFAFTEAALHFLPAFFFAGIAALGARLRSPEVLGLGFLLHGLFGLAGLALDFHAPLFFAELSVGFDVTAAVLLRSLAPSGEHLVDVQHEDRARP